MMSLTLAENMDTPEAYHSEAPCRDTPDRVGNRTAIYLRVSKGEQHTTNQRPDVERVIATGFR